MNAQLTALSFSLACWLASSNLPAAHSQISGTISTDGTATQNQHSTSSDQPDLEAAAEKALEQGDKPEAFLLYFQACFADSSFACIQAADLLDQNADLAPDPFTTIPLYTRACDLGDDAACGEVQSIFAVTESRCENDEPEACTASAYLQLNNLTEISYAPQAAAIRFDKACGLGHGQACTELGYLYATGRGVEKNDERAGDFFAQACSAQNAEDCVRIGEFYLHGRPIAMDVDRAAEYFEAGCIFGDTFSCQKLGYAYLTGSFVPHDIERARTFLTRACDAGMVSVCNDIPTSG